MNLIEKNVFLMNYIEKSQKYQELKYQYNYDIGYLIQTKYLDHSRFLNKIENFEFDNYFTNILTQANLIQQHNIFIKIKLIIYGEYLIELYEKVYKNNYNYYDKFAQDLENHFSKISTRVWVHSDDFINILFAM